MKTLKETITSKGVELAISYLDSNQEESIPSVLSEVVQNANANSTNINLKYIEEEEWKIAAGRLWLQSNPCEKYNVF